MRTLSLIAGILFGLAELLGPASAATVYAVSDVLGPVTLGGTITTDGTTGVLGVANIVDFDVTLTGNSTVHIKKSTNQVPNFITGTALTATSSGLFFDFSGVGLFELFISNSAEWFMCASSGCTPTNDWFVNGGGKSNVLLNQTGKIEFAFGPPDPTPTTPLPSALSLFAAAASGLGLLLWRRKRINSSWPA